MPDKIKLRTGVGGEREAARFLVENGYEILEKNYRVAGSEVDLIAKKDDTLCFVEVKTRGSDDYGLPEEFVDRRKRQKIIRAARIYSAQDKFQELYIRFDIIALLYQADDPVSGLTNPVPKLTSNRIINHIQHAFEASS